MSAVFDPLRLSSVSLDVAAAQRGTPQGIAERQNTRLTALLGSTLRGSRLYRALWPAGTTASTPPAAAPTRGARAADGGLWRLDDRPRA